MTYQLQLHSESQSRIEAATQRNRVDVGHSHGVVGLIARDKSMRTVYVTLSDPQIDALIDQLIDAKRKRNSK